MAMLDAVKQFFGRHMDPNDAEVADEAASEGEDDKLEIAAAALLLELAHADDEFNASERAHLEETLVRHFAVSEDRARELMELADAERRRAVDLYQFTRLIAERYDEGQKMVLAEVMWRMAYADGELAKHESYLMRKVSNLLELRPGYLASAKKRALEAGEL
jgi:uncharacterized tellurite resistance protein B-like protein